MHRINKEYISKASGCEINFKLSFKIKFLTQREIKVEHGFGQKEIHLPMIHRSFTAHSATRVVIEGIDTSSRRYPCQR